MSEIKSFEKLNNELEAWICHLEEMLSCAFVFKFEEDLPLVAANSAFYNLVEYSKDEIKVKYNSCLSVLFDETALKKIDKIATNQGSGLFKSKHKIKKKSGICHVEVAIKIVRFAGSTYFCCVAHDISNYVTRDEELTSFEQTIRVAASQAKVDYFEYDFVSKDAIIRSNCSVFPKGLTDGEGRIKNFINRLVEDNIVAEESADDFIEAFKTDNKISLEIKLNTAEKRSLWTRLTMVLKPQGHQLVGIIENINQEKESALNYLNETQFYQAILSEKDAYAQVDATDNKIMKIGGMWNLYNEVIEKISYSELIQQFIFKVVHPDDRKQYFEIMQCTNFIDSLNNGIDRLGCQFRRIVDQNKMVWMELDVHLFRNPLSKHVHALLTIKNINQKKHEEIMLVQSTKYDYLTNMYNKRATEDLAREALSQARKEELSAFIILDVDNLKHINDNQGHTAGDFILKNLSTILGSAFRRTDIVGRYGGDEFIIFLRNVESEKIVTARLDGLYQQLSENHFFDTISCSIGVAIKQGNTPYELLFEQADIALSHAKSSGKNRYLIFNENMTNCDSSDIVKTRKIRTDVPVSLFEQNVATEYWNIQNDAASFDTFIGEIGDIAYLCDAESFELICGNKAFFDRIGLSEIQCNRMKCYELMHKRDTPCPFCSRANWSTDKFYMWRNVNRNLEQEFLIKNRLVQWRGKEVLLVIAVDMSNNKSIVDSMDSADVETHSILSGVQRLSSAQNLTEAMNGAMETISTFFLADAVRLWQYNAGSKSFVFNYAWTKNPESDLTLQDLKEINSWLETRTWNQPIVVETPEAMLGYSYELYQQMVRHKIKNQRWIIILDNEEVLGFISIDNVTINFQNVAFLKSFLVFVANELQKRCLVENALYSQRHDDLTDLLSRKSFEDYMGNYKADEVACMSVCVANINNLKGVNTSRGFQTGNYFIKQFAQMLKTVFADQLIFRLNGDEFVVIAPEVTRSSTIEEIGALEQLINADKSFSVSIGSAWDDIEKDISVLIEQATTNMKVNKKRHYDSGEKSFDNGRRKMLNDLIESIDNNAFEVFLQPKKNLATNVIYGAEALIRYFHKEHGYIPPAMFVELLEKNNLIRYIDLFVLEEVCKLLEKLKKEGKQLPVVSLNFSRITLLERGICEHVETIVSRYDADRSYIEIEITESIATMSNSVLFQAVQGLQKAGFTISLDDFGTKYTNLSILAQLEIGTLKVDRSITSELATSKNHRLIMKSVVTMCENLEIEVLAEGIETIDQETILKQLGCFHGQGYLYGKPMPIAEFVEKFID